MTMPQTALQQLQQAFCLINLEGKVRVTERHPKLILGSSGQRHSHPIYEIKDGKLMLQRHLEAQPYDCDPAKVIRDFLVDPATHVYTEIAFTPVTTPPTTLNFWVGPTLIPSPGNWSVIKQHLLEVICSSDSTLYQYLICFLAHMVQYPQTKPGVMVTLLGRQGTGKGLFFKVLKRIWPVSSLMIANLDHVLGTFNSTLERNFVIMLDEALFVGDRRSQDRLKSMITEPTVHIEAKFQPSRTIESVHRFFASSNRTHFSHVEADDRRNLFLRVSDSKIGDFAYFDALVTAIDDDAVIAALLHELTLVDLTGFNIRQRPESRENQAQQLRSLEGFDQFWFEVITSAALTHGTQPTTYWTTGHFWGSTQLQECFQSFTRGAKYSHRLTTRELSEHMRRLCPSAKHTRKKLAEGFIRGYELPLLEVARQDFEAALGMTIGWGDPPEYAETPAQLNEVQPA